MSDNKIVTVKKGTKKKKVKKVSVEKTQPIEEVDIPKIKEEQTEEIEKVEVEDEVKEPTTEQIQEPKKKKRKKLNPKAVLVIFIILIPIFVLVGLSIFNKEEPKKEEKVVEKPKKKKEKEEKEVPKIKIVDENSTSRPFAIMINNAPVARPVQSGLQDAYIIYEIIVEGGVTRYMALFLDQNTERIGSVRSARHYYLDYALENDAIYVHHGRSPQAAADFSNLGVTRIEVAEGKTGWRDKSLNVAWEHKLFTNIEKLKKGLNGKRTERNKDLLLNYSIEPVDLASMDNSIEANDVVIKYSNATTSSYKYDEKEKVYKRYVNGKEHTDYVTKKQYTFKNIITYRVGNYTLDDPENKGRQGLNNIGSGSGYYISEGRAIPIRWSKSSRREQTKYMLENGEELTVNDGNTFIQIQPRSFAPSIS